MVRCALALASVLALGLSCAWPQSSQGVKSAPAKKEALFGLSFLPVPEVVYDHVPRLPRGLGVLVEQVRADSPAEQAGLKRHDILLGYNGKDIKDADQFSRLVQGEKPDRKVPLVLIRGGKEMTLDVSLAALGKAADPEPVRYFQEAAKNGRPPAVNCEATVIGGGKMKVTFEYYPEGKSKLVQVTYSGSLKEIEAQVKNLPMPVQDLALVALKRLRDRKYR
jgi:membrane-associated protease RseP (regulator of RpoE activity)